MTSHASNRNGGTLLARNELSMPKWVSEQSGRVGPKPPPPPSTLENGQLATKQPVLPQKIKQPEPDYEVIEFSNQQYSNAPLRPNSASSGSKTPDNKLKCTLCGSGNPWVTCDECAQQIFCASCDDMFHKHPKRKTHQRKTIEKSLPPLPPKILPGQPGPTPPVAPPRRNKRGFMTPIMQRKDQGSAMTGAFQESTSPTASTKNSSWQERLGSLPRGLNLLNRPLPETPKSPSESSRSTTPKSAFDNIQRPPSVVLEKIKSKTNATLDRMQVLQQRYRQQKEQMERERSGSGSVTDQNMSAFDQWSSISQSPSHFRSGSMSSGINSSHLDLMDDTNFNLFHQRQAVMQHHQIAAQRANQLGQRGISSSVFNLNQMNRKQPIANSGWSNNHLQQAQSMAQLNCGNCSQHQLQWNGRHMQKNQDPWSNQLASQQHLNRSNMSLNVPAGYMMQPHMNNVYPPPAFMNQRNLMPQMYPQPYMGGMPVMNPGLICMPPPTSRATSRAGSRMASPAMSRKSVTLRRKQHSNYFDDEATDDEDSDEDDRRSITSTRSGLSRPLQRRLSSVSQFQTDDDIEINHGKQHRNRTRNQRRDSIAKSVHNDWAPGRRPSLINNNRSTDSGFNSPLKSSRIYSDLDSEGSATKALVQAKIEQKLKEESLKQKQSKSKRQSKSPPPQKACAAVQTPAIKPAKKQEKIKEPMKRVEKSVENELESKHEANTNHKNSKKVKEQQQTKAEQKYASKSLSESEKENENESELESEKSATSDSKQINDEVYQIEEDKIEKDDLGPPPSTPDHEWECEFCTFVNEANIKICSICCKTPSVKPKTTNISISPPKQTKQTTQTTGELKTNTIRRNSATASEKLFNQHSMTNNKETPTVAKNSAQNKSKANTDTLKQNKESLEDIWDTFDENIQTTASEITRKAQSKVNSTNVELQENFTRQSQAKEIDTSPTPQNISTQTYDSVPLQKPEKPIPEPFFNDMIQHSHFPASPKIQDLESFEAEVLNKIHNISHIPPSHCHNQQSTINYYKDRPRYRSNNELCLNDTTSADFEPFNNLLGKRQASISELLLVPKSPPQINSPFVNSIYDIPYRELSSMKHSDMDNHKESDLYKYTTEELNAALKYCGPDIHPLVWLRDNWPKLIQTVQSLATKYGQERAENTIGTISQMEAREALHLHTGNIWQAVSECIEQRQRKYKEISSKGNFSREDIVTALTIQQGNVELALLDLGRTQLKPFLMRIWGSPGGVENESGSQLLQTATAHSPTCFNMDKDIHSFLSANASECMQTPNVTGAYLSNNQTPSPFDRPASLSSPLDSNSFIQEKISADSSLQLDESVLSNKNVLKDLEILIGNMEHNQQKQNEHLLRSVQDMISNVNLKIENEYDSESMRILAKSPIISPKLKSTCKENASKNEADVKEFVWQHIQEIVPDLVQQVEMELVGDNTDELNSNELGQIDAIPAPPPPPIDHDEFLMEEVIKPNVKNAYIREELPPQYFYTGAEIAPFQIAFDKGLEREHDEEFEFVTLEQASKQIHKMFKSPEVDTKTKEQPSATPDDLLKDNVSMNNEDKNAQELHQLASFSNVNALGVEAPVVETSIQTRSSSKISDDLLKDKVSMNNEDKNVQELHQLASFSNENSLEVASPVVETNIQTRSPSEISDYLLKDKVSMNNEDKNAQELHQLASFNNENSLDVKTPVVETNIETRSSFEMSNDLLSNDIRSSPILESETNILSPTSAVTQIGVIESPLTVSHDSKNANIETKSHQSDKSFKFFEETLVKQIKTNNESMINNNQPIKASSIEVANDMKENAETLNQTHKHNEEFKNNSKEDKQTNTENSFKQSEQTKSITEFNEIPNQSSQNSNFLDVAQLDPSAVLENASNININIADPVQQQNKSEIIAAVDTKDSKNETSVTATNKRISKIPIRRTASNKSLVNSSTISNKIDFNGEKIKSPDSLNLVASTTETESSDMTLDQTEMNDLYGSASTTFSTETLSRADQLESPTPSNEMFLVIQQEGSENANISNSNSTLNSTISQSFSFKSPTEFVPSGDPSKQNLTELVEDTQRLIKQMKDEISIDDFESSTDEGDYSDEFYDEYDDEEEGEEEEDWEEEEDEEYDDITEDITEENEEVYGVEEDFIDNTKQSASPTQESQDLNTPNHNLVSSHHSLTFLHDNFEQVDQIINPNKEIQSENIIFNDTAVFVETENNLPELPVEAVIDNNLEISKLSTQYVESENTLPEMAVEIVLSKHETQNNDKTLNDQNHFNTPINSNEEMSLVKDSTNVILASTLNTNKVQPKNDIPSLIIQAAAAAEPVTKLEAEAKSENLNQETNTTTSEMDSTTYQHELLSKSTANQVSTTILKNQPKDNNNSETETAEAKKDDVTAPNKGVKSSQVKKKLSEASTTAVKKPFTTSKIPKPKEVTKQSKQKVVPVPEPKIDFKKKYTRSKSFSGPTTPIGIASVRSISQKFANPPPSNQLTKPKTSNAVTRKSSIAETINKFTKPSSSSVKSAAASSLLKSRTHPRIPKKKYHETCFSDDDYESSTEEEELEPLEVRQRKLSVPVFKTYPSIQEQDEANTEQLIEKFTKENLAATVAEAQIAAALVAMKFPQDVSLWAAKECSDLDHAIALLKHECELCSGTYALNQIVSMLKCTHKCCKQCAKTYFTVQITERSINDCNCPFCKLPELHNQTEYEDENLEYFSNLDIFLKSILEPEVHELFQRKLRDRTLLKDPNFKWCVQCSSGFFARPKQKRLICPDCGSVTCAQCRKTWQKQHEGISCDQFLKWESANDPEVQAKGVQQHLDQNGIDCPKCKFKYSLARGGCMHFTCTQCKYEFCYGCAKPFMMGAKCNISSYCAKLGLHAHHPRNCLFYLRDKLPVQLQILLKNNNVTFEVDPLRFADNDNDNDNEPTSSKKKETLCPIPIQKETPTGLVDTRCNGDVPDKHAGMCRNHYVEYLTAKVAKAKIDPLPIFDLTDCVQELRRRGIPLPERGPWDTDEIYKNMCAEVIQKNIPLNIE